MEQEDNEIAARKILGRDELNLAEFPLSLIGRRAPGNAKTLQFSDVVYDRSLGRNVTRKLTVSAADLLGLPTAVDDEVLLGCIQLSQEQKFNGPKVLFERANLLDILGWKRSGKDYKRLTDSLNRWKGTLIISENAFWDRGEQCWVNDSFSILNRVYISGRGRKEEGRDLVSFFEWGDFMWRSIESGNLRMLDFEFLKSLDSSISKRLYRLLSKRFYHGPTVRFGLRQLAHEKVGLSRNMHTGQIKEKLQTGHNELESRGVCQSKFVEKKRGDWEVVYTSIASKERASHAPPPIPLEQELVNRGVDKSGHLVQAVSKERIAQAIENYDDRKKQGEALGPGWLRECITRKRPFDFRQGYISKAATAAKEKTAAQKQKAQKLAQQQAKENKRVKLAQSRQAFLQFIQSLPSDEEREAYAKRAIESNRFFRDFFHESQNQGNAAKAERHKQDAMLLLWERENATAA